jgi:hypothetical protein
LAVTLEGVHHVGGSDCLPTGVLGVKDRVLEDFLQEVSQDDPSLIVDTR